ncbi:protein Shroom [Onthophagus taurus]|uniref:protein Shroom n=1 Tax=Onthophagus taurus TaxID=166361 RepID=UPI000C1FF7A9|nr:protein Shroom [Onthophagus taurus]XP_022921126.1 protein Shroom [Onthophagus taurus]
MMPSRSTPNLQQTPPQPIREGVTTSTNANVGNQQTAVIVERNDDSPPPAPPVRDASSLKSIKYGPGHEKFPSWPVPAAADAPQATKAPPGGGSHRSKSWTDHTNYPKEKVVTYTRPYMKRQHSSHIQQKLKTVLERCEKIPPETFESRCFDKLNDCMYLPHVDRDGKSLGDMEYTVPSPPERDVSKPQLTQEELEEYARSYQETSIEKLEMKGLENFIEYARSYEEFHIKQHDDTVLAHLHQKQLSYAQSEGYHSYVSSTDSTSTPFLDRLRRDSEAVATARWEEDQESHLQPSRREGRDSVVTTSSGSASSSETLKWHGSMSDVSVASSCTHLVNSSSSSSVQRQHIAHSARVQTPQRHYSESVLQKNNDNESTWKDKEKRNNSNNKLKLFAVNTYTVQGDETKRVESTASSTTNGASSQLQNRLSQPLPLSVADRINELEKQQRYSYLDPNKKHKVPDPTLKAIQKKALLSFYERHHNNTPSKTSTWRSEPQLAQAQPALTVAPQPPPRVKTHQTPSRRASCASDYSSSKRTSLASRDSKEISSGKITARHKHSNSCGSLSTDLLGPVIVGPSISLDDWVPEKPPERPPKNPHLRLAYPDLFQDQRVPSPDLPPPSPPPILEDEVIQNDDPLPPPPPEIDWRNSDMENSTTTKQFPAPQVQSSRNNNSKLLNDDLCLLEPPKKPLIGLPERGNPRYSSVRYLPSEHRLSQNNSTSETRHSISDTPWSSGSKKSKDHSQHVFSFPNHRNYERSSTRYPSVHKLVLNGNVAVSQKISNGISEYRAEPLRTITVSENTSPLKESPRHVGNMVNQRASIAEGPLRDVPPPLQPRQMRINQSMRARIPESRASPPRDHTLRDSRQLNYTMSQSKASYMASRRERDKIIPDPDSGSYKRTLSPNGHIITANDTTTTQETSKLSSREPWSTLKNKEQYTNNNNNNGNIMRRPSMCEPAAKNGGDIKEDLKKTQQQPLVLPDVLPINAKILSPRSQHHHHITREFRPSNLSLSPLDNNYQPAKSPPKSPPPPTNSPPKSPSRNSPYAPLRSTNLSNSPLRTPSLRLSSPQGSSSPISSTPQYSSPLRVYPGKESTAEIRSNSLCLQRNETKTMQRASFHQEIRTSNVQRISPSTSPNSSFSSVSSQSMSLPGRFSPTPKVVPEIKPTLSPNLSNKMIPIKSFSPSMAFMANTPLKTSPESSPPSSPKVLSSSPPPSPKNLSIAPSSPETPKEIITSKVIEGLQMIQRTEVVLRVNTTTIDASSQTEKEELPPTPLPTRRKLQEEIDCEKLSQDFVNQLPVTDKLKDLLVPAPEHKKITDYVTGLFRVDVTLKPRPINAPFRSRNHTPSSTPPPTCNSGPSSSTSMTSSDTISIISSLEPTSPLPATSPYFTTSEPKAKFLTRYSQDMNHYTIKNTKDLNRKKDELVNRLDRKLEVLRGEQLVVSEECRINDELGQNVEDHIAKVARTTETAKFRLHIEEVGKITSLLLGLSGRLARVENALIGMCEDNPEKRILETKRDKLLDQLEEAKKLKESIDKRSVSVSNILYKYLNSEEYADYDHFINMKAKLIMDSKDIADKIKLGEEQLMALKETLIVSD